MARARNIKPGFFTNERLATLPFEARLLFEGLWLLADHEGRLEDRPGRIKGEIFPHDNLDVDALLNMLHITADEGDGHTFIIRYKVDGKRFIWIPKFSEHQHPHKKERDIPSRIPPYGQVRSNTDPEIPGVDREIPGVDPEIPGPTRLIPDSGFLIPDTGYRNGATGEKRPPAPDLSDSFEEIYARHPKKGHRISAQGAYSHIRGIREPAERERIAAAHRAWCQCERWRWKGGASAPFLDEWITDRGYDYDPPATESPPNQISAAEAMLAKRLEAKHAGKKGN